MAPSFSPHCGASGSGRSTSATTARASATPWFVGEFGRIRDVAVGPDGSLWFLTNNTDGRGDVRDGDDRLMQVRLVPLVEG